MSNTAGGGLSLYPTALAPLSILQSIEKAPPQQMILHFKLSVEPVFSNSSLTLIIPYSYRDNSPKTKNFSAVVMGKVTIPGYVCTPALSPLILFPLKTFGYFLFFFPFHWPDESPWRNLCRIPSFSIKLYLLWYSDLWALIALTPLNPKSYFLNSELHFTTVPFLAPLNIGKTNYFFLFCPHLTTINTKDLRNPKMCFSPYQPANRQFCSSEHQLGAPT